MRYVNNCVLSELKPENEISVIIEFANFTFIIMAIIAMRVPTGIQTNSNLKIDKIFTFHFPINSSNISTPIL